MDEIYAALEGITHISVINTTIGFDVSYWADDLDRWCFYGRSNQDLSEALSSIEALK